MNKKTGTRTTTKVVAISSLVPDARNARKHGERNRAEIRASLEEHGQVSPLVVQASTMRILAGNGTYQQMVGLGYETCEIKLIQCDDVEAQKIAIRLNRTAEHAEWDEAVLAGILEELDGAAVGFDDDEIAAILKQAEKDARPVIAMIAAGEEAEDEGPISPRVEHEETEDGGEDEPAEKKPAERPTESITIPATRLQKRRWEGYVKKTGMNSRAAFFALLDTQEGAA